jgi:hypothetical protein
MSKKNQNKHFDLPEKKPNFLVFQANILDGLAREISVQGEGDGTACAVVNQL